MPKTAARPATHPGHRLIPFAAAILVLATPIGAAAASAPGGPGTIHPDSVRPARPASGGGSSKNLVYHGGIADGTAGSVGVETRPAVYIDYWGWTSDPSGEAAYQQSFFSGVGGSAWNNSVTQYGAGNPTGVLAGTWSDGVNPLPKKIGQSALAAEAVRAAAHFGRTDPVANASVQYVIATPTGHSASGFGSYCAWHSSTTSSYGLIAYTNFPYQTDVGPTCGEFFVNCTAGQTANGLAGDGAPCDGIDGTLDGVSIVGGHEFAESETDQFPNGGWLDGSGQENGDKCAWSSSSTDISLGGHAFAVQPLWSNASSSCVTSF
jgi:serine protease